MPPMVSCSVNTHIYTMKNHEWKNQYSIRKTYLYSATIQKTCEVDLTTIIFSKIFSHLFLRSHLTDNI